VKLEALKRREGLKVSGLKIYKEELQASSPALPA